jgi:hypothetical protein
MCGTCTTVCSSRSLSNVSPQGQRIEFGFWDGNSSPAAHIANSLVTSEVAHLIACRVAAGMGHRLATSLAALRHYSLQWTQDMVCWQGRAFLHANYSGDLHGD